MKKLKVHKDFDVAEYLQDLRDELQLYKQQLKYNVRLKDHNEALHTFYDIQMLEFMIEDLTYFVENGRHV